MRANDPSVFEVLGPPELPTDPATVIAALRTKVTEARLGRIEAVAARRTLGVVPVLENIADPHNASAILRSADAFGIERVEVIASERTFLASHQVAKGTQRWLDLRRHDSARACVEALRSQGYRTYVARMNGEHSPEAIAGGDRIAVVFGNEHRGASPAMLEAADGTFAIPMEGFVESLNVSVAAAVTLYILTRADTKRASSAERERFVARYLMSSVNGAHAIVSQYLRGRGSETTTSWQGGDDPGAA